MAEAITDLDGEEAISIDAEALERSDIVIPEFSDPVDGNLPLGAEQYDRWICSLLRNAGVEVQRLQNGADLDEPLHQSVMLASTADLNRHIVRRTHAQHGSRCVEVSKHDS